MRTFSRLAWIAGIVSICASDGAAVAGPSGAHKDHAVVASGTLDGRFLAGLLFHIDEFWMKVASGTEFHRWLSQGLGHPVVIRLVRNTARLADEKNVRILSGLLMHQTVPKLTPATTDVVGRLPRGDSGLVHMYFVIDAIADTATLSAITFESADLATVSKFNAFEGARISIVIEIH